MDGKKISVIVPVYNSIDCLERCVRSICAQTYANLEILLIDDGSTDGTDQLCERLADQDDRIRVHHKKNGGASSARNVGIDLSTGDYLGFVDSDDYVDADVYEKLAEALEKGNYSVVQISRDEVDEEGGRLPDICMPPEKERFCSSETFLRELLMHRGDCSFCTKLFLREIFDAAVDAVKQLSTDVGIPTDLKEIVKKEDIPFLAQSAYDDACRPGNPKETSVEDITKLYEALI